MRRANSNSAIRIKATRSAISPADNEPLLPPPPPPDPPSITDVVGAEVGGKVGESSSSEEGVVGADVGLGEEGATVGDRVGVWEGDNVG